MDFFYSFLQLCALKNHSAINITFYKNNLDEINNFTLSFRESLPPQWHDFSPENIRVAKQEAEASNRLRGMISSTLSQTSADMREQADRVEEALNRRLFETEEATRALEDELKAVRIFRACVVNSFIYVFEPELALLVGL